VKTAAERLTGFTVRVTARGLEIPVESEVQLEELAEALERLELAPDAGPAALDQ
jgi:hypothetical protein